MAEDLRHVIGRLQAFNSAHAPFAFERKDIRLFVRDASGEILGGLLGNVGLHCLVIQILWVEDDHRRQGIGQSLVTEAEQQAMALGAIQSIVETTSFQAPGFYEGLGYHIIFEIADAPIGAKTVFLRKALSS